MTPNELAAAIKAKKFGFFLLTGEEDYLIRYYLSTLRSAILTDEGFAPFNHILLEGKIPDAEALLEAVSAPPMFSDYKLVEWHGADFTGIKDADLTALCSLAERAAQFPECCVVIVTAQGGLDCGTLPRRPSKIYKTLSEVMSVVVFDRSDERQLVGWLVRHFAHEGVTVTPSFATLMITRCGRGMTTLVSEVEKLSAYAKANGKSTLTQADLDFVSVADPEFDAFALSDALYRLDGGAALAAIGDQKRRRVRPEIVMGSVISAFATLLTVSELSAAGLSAEGIAEQLKMHEFRVKRAQSAASRRAPEFWQDCLAACRDADVASKSGGAVGYAAVEGLVASLLGN